MRCNETRNELAFERSFISLHNKLDCRPFILLLCSKRHVGVLLACRVEHKADLLVASHEDVGHHTVHSISRMHHVSNPHFTMADVAFAIRMCVSVSSLKDTLYALGTHSPVTR